VANTADSERQELADSRDRQLRTLLPSKDSPYDFYRLSQAETDALEEAFSDGFGAAVAGSEALPLPRGIKSGLLQHPFYFRNAWEDDEDSEDAFWHSPSSGAPAPYETVPINFIPRRLRMYFKNQLDRFCHKMISEEPHFASSERQYVEDHALDRLYEKPWYEAHALELFDIIDIDGFLLRGVKSAKGAAGRAFLVSCFAGELGRLIEQYYWRFRFEGAAITGLGARKGASAGGISRAALHRTQHCAWQKAAAEIWGRRPKLSKLAVAEIIRKQVGARQTAKHIARYISRAPATRNA